MIDALLALFGACAALFAVLALFQRSLFSGALCVLLTSLFAADIFFLAGAQLLGLIQALVYAGAIMILLVVAAMSSPPGSEGLWARDGERAGPPWARWLGALAILGQALGFAALAASRTQTFWSPPGIERRMAFSLFGPYALMTEAAGAILLLSSLAISGGPGSARESER